LRSPTRSPNSDAHEAREALHKALALIGPTQLRGIENDIRERLAVLGAS
jgi:hypothetical protein